MGAQWLGWGMPAANMGTMASEGAGRNPAEPRHPSVPNTGYNTVPITAMLYTDYSTPLGDHLTPAVKGKFEEEIILIFTNY